MVSDILNAAGVQHKEVRFIQPPDGTYAAWFDTVEARGSDNKVLIFEHSSTIELYAVQIDAASEKKIEDELSIRALDYEKSDRLWLKDEQRFMTVYSFDYIEKRR